MTTSLPAAGEGTGTLASASDGSRGTANESTKSPCVAACSGSGGEILAVAPEWSPWERGRPARLKDRGPAAHLRAGRPRSQEDLPPRSGGRLYAGFRRSDRSKAQSGTRVDPGGMDVRSARAMRREMTVQMAHYRAVHRLGTAPVECPQGAPDDVRTAGDSIQRLSPRLSLDLRAGGRAPRRPSHRKGARGAGEHLYRRRHLQQGRALRRTYPSPGSSDHATAPRRGEGLRGQLRAGGVGRRARHRGGVAAEGRAAPRLRGGVALLLRGHHGARDARRDPPAAPRQALLGAALHHLRHARLERVHRGHRAARGSGPARDGEVRPRGHLGHQRRVDAGQRDDARAGGAAPARRPRRRRSTPTATRPRSRRICSCACVPAPTARSPAR